MSQSYSKQGEERGVGTAALGQAYPTASFCNFYKLQLPFLLLTLPAGSGAHIFPRMPQCVRMPLSSSRIVFVRPVF